MAVRLWATPSGCVPYNRSRFRPGSAVAKYGSVFCPCTPVPIMSALDAPSRAQCFAVIAVVAGVRAAPMRWQSMSAKGNPVVSS
ncbi:hypothetical protein D6158_27485 [Nocardia seriolae]|nr:hypothetical protein C6575_27905 [Nocardia seriolae]RLP28788.1 hypothetical protein D6158_27485 [Nocardia seriolae]